MKHTKSILTAALTVSLLLGGCGRLGGNDASDDSSRISQTESSAVEAASAESFVEGSLPSGVSDISGQSSEAGETSTVSEKSGSLPENSDVSQKPRSSDIPVQQSSEVTEPEPPDLSKLYHSKYKYFVNELSEDQLRNFIKMYDAVVHFQSSVNFDRTISEDELTTLMYLLNYDCPELIHVSGDYYPHYINDKNDVSGVGFSFCMSEKEYALAMEEMNKFFADLKKELAFNSDIEKEKAVYDYIFNNCIYDEYDLLSGSAYGTLIQHKGRCEGFSKSFMWCMNELDVECMAVAGLQYWNEGSRYANHSWNIVKIKGNYYHLDVTVDNVRLSAGQVNPPDYGFYNVSDEYIEENREMVSLYKELGVPKCDAMIENYHTKRDLFIYYDDFYRINLFTILSSHFDDEKLGPVSIKFYNQADYSNAVASIDNDVGEFLDENADQVFHYQTYYSDLSRTIVIEANPAEEKPDSGEE